MSSSRMNPLEIIWKNIKKPDSIYWFKSASLENIENISMYCRTLKNTWLFMEAKFCCACNGGGGPDLFHRSKLAESLTENILVNIVCEIPEHRHQVLGRANTVKAKNNFKDQVNQPDHEHLDLAHNILPWFLLFLGPSCPNLKQIILPTQAQSGTYTLLSK